MVASARPARPSQLGEVIATVRYLGGRLLGSRLLLGYVALSVAASALQGVGALGPAVFNYVVLLPIYTLAIYLTTRGEPTAADAVRAEPEGGMRRDLGLVVGLFALNVAGVVYFWRGGIPLALLRSVRDVLVAAGWNPELASTTANALVSVGLTLLPCLVVMLIVLRPRQIGLAPRHLGLAVGLIAFGIAIAGLVRLAFGQSSTLYKHLDSDGLGGLPLVLAIYVAQMFVNGLSEELIFRGGMLGRLLRWVANPHHALVLVSFLFVAMHIPSYLAKGSADSPLALAAAVLGPQPTGLIWGYLFYRTRSIWPGVLWHTSFTTLGALFF